MNGADSAVRFASLRFGSLRFASVCSVNGVLQTTTMTHSVICAQEMNGARMSLYEYDDS